MMSAKSLAINTGAVVKADPVGSMKAFLFFLLAAVLLYVAWRVFKGVKSAADVIADLAPSTDAEEAEVISDPGYQKALPWLGATQGIEYIVRSKKYGVSVNGAKVDFIGNYLAAKKLNRSQLTVVADRIAAAKLPIVGFYVNAQEVMDAAASLPSKAAISLMAGMFNQIYGKTLTGYPLDGYISKYLSLSEKKALAQVINSKPDL